MKILVKAEKEGKKDIKLNIPLFLASNKIAFGIMWGNVKVKVEKELPFDKKEIYALYKILLKELKYYKGLELVNVSKENKNVVSIVI